MKKFIKLVSQAVPSAKKTFIDKIEYHVREGIKHDVRLAAKFYPYQPDSPHYLLEPAAAPAKDAALPVPPRELWWGYGQTPEEYLELGRGYVAAMKDIVQASGAPLAPGNRILDVGCASGIMLRWLQDFAQAGEVWGVDISETHMYWCQRHLSPPFRFATTTSFPHLPFEDGYFDFIYAGSVFTHIADLSEMWLLELKRITRTGGKLYLTIHDEHTVDLVLSDGYKEKSFQQMLLDADREIQFRSRGFGMFTVNRTPGAGVEGEAQVFHHTRYIREHWSRYLQVLSITPEAYGKQSAVLLRK